MGILVGHDGQHRAGLALDVYAYRVKRTVGALAAAIDGLDALVFTGGIGENPTWLRREVCKSLQFLRVRLDADRNADCHPDADIATEDSSVRVLIIHTREDLMIDRESRRLALECQ